MDILMKKDKKAKELPQQNKCFCGALLEPAEGEFGSDAAVCPQCGAVRTQQPTDVSVADTQQVNIAEMARMAQEGVDPATSGEWITRLDRKDKERK
jgi:hypothetical protein